MAFADPAEVIQIANDDYLLEEKAPTSQDPNWSITLNNTTTGQSYICEMSPSLGAAVGRTVFSHEMLYQCLLLALLERKPKKLQAAFKFCHTVEAETDPERIGNAS